MDIGDDPAMMVATMPGPGVNTWGICRRAERNRVGRGDLIVFFAADRLSDRRPARYCWVGYATVDWKVAQVDIWTIGELAGLRDYPNLLIRPSGTGDVHCEQWHADGFQPAGRHRPHPTPLCQLRSRIADYLARHRIQRGRLRRQRKAQQRRVSRPLDVSRQLCVDGTCQQR
jgi:hypothetical protein